MPDRDYDAGDLAAAYAYAADAHGGQVDDWDGQPYLHHVLDVARGVRELGLAHEIVAILHDVVEDTGRTVADIEARFGAEIARGVDAMSKREGEDFFADYMPRVVADPIARNVKISDATANRKKAVRAEDAATREKYVRKYDRAIAMLRTGTDPGP